MGDFGLGREIEYEMTAVSMINKRVVTLWYRPPELLLGDPEKRLTQYDEAADMWAAGLIFGEMWKRSPLLPGNEEQKQISLIFELCGTPSDRNWPNYQDLYWFRNNVGNFTKKIPTLSDLFRAQEYIWLIAITMTHTAYFHDCCS